MTTPTSPWAHTWTGSHVRHHANGVVTTGTTEPILSILDLAEFDLYDLYLIGINADRGRIFFPSQDRAAAAGRALAPAYTVTVSPLKSPAGHRFWTTSYTRHVTGGGPQPAHVVTDVTLKDGSVVRRGGYPTSQQPPAPAGGRSDVAEALAAEGWASDPEDPRSVLRHPSGAVWAVLDAHGDSGLRCPDGAVAKFAHDTPPVVIVAACFAAVATPGTDNGSAA